MNKILCLFFLTFSLALKANIVFLNASEAGEFLATPDAYTYALNPLDFSLHYSSNKTFTLADHLAFLKTTTLDWTAEEKKLITDENELLNKAIIDLDLKKWTLPENVFLIKTNGLDEYKAHYTRRNAIIFPIDERAHKVTTAAQVYFHEMFHVMSRFHPELHDGLYEVCHFKPIVHAEIPFFYRERQITNPDAFTYEHALYVNAGDKAISIIPFMYSGVLQSEINGPVDESITFKLGLIDIDSGNAYKVIETDYKNKAEVNTHYYIHPEEIMAENFRLMIALHLGLATSKEIQNPSVIERLMTFLRE